MEATGILQGMEHSKMYCTSPLTVNWQRSQFLRIPCHIHYLHGIQYFKKMLNLQNAKALHMKTLLYNHAVSSTRTQQEPQAMILK